MASTVSSLPAADRLHRIDPALANRYIGDLLPFYGE